VVISWIPAFAGMTQKMNKNTIKRLICDLLILISVMNGWWPIAIVVGLFGNWFFLYFIEIIIAGVIFDSLFGYNQYLGVVGYYGTIITVVIFIIISGLKKVLGRGNNMS